jgi:hypothetical protein
MQIRTVPAKLVCVGALLVCTGLTACHPKSVRQAKADLIGGGAHISAIDPIKEPVTIADKLNCPDEEGELKRTSAASDGRSCAYSSDRGVVELSLMDAPGGDATQALAPVRAGIDAMLPHQASAATVQVSSENVNGRDVSKVDMPFIHVSDDGRHSHVKVFGINIDADDDAKNKTGDVSSGPRASEYVYILAGSPASAEGYHAAGYVARSDAEGKVVVATFKYRNGDNFVNHGEDHDSDLNALMDLNAKKG